MPDFSGARNASAGIYCQAIRIATCSGLCLARNTNDVAQALSYFVDDIPYVLQLLALDADELYLMGGPPFACRSSGADGKHEVSPVLWSKMRVELNDERRCFHSGLTPMSSRDAKRRRLVNNRMDSSRVPHGFDEPG